VSVGRNRFIAPLRSTLLLGTKGKADWRNKAIAPYQRVVAGVAPLVITTVTCFFAVITSCGVTALDPERNGLLRSLTPLRKSDYSRN
jgi:hypothetical protein